MAKKDMNGWRLQDEIQSEILETRRLFLGEDVNQNSAKEIIEKAWYLEIKDPGKPIILLINSPGGSVDAGFAIWDQLKMLTSPVTTVVTGLAASMGSVLSLVAPKGKRFATKNARIMIHQPLIGGVIQGQASDLEIHAKEILKTREKLVSIYVEATGKKSDEIDQAIDRDNWLTVKEAMDFGLIDQVVDSYASL